LLTAGPTREPLDPVRYFSNHSSGKMGYAIAAELLQRGARVTLISGPVKEKLSHANLSIIKVNTADEMFQAASKEFSSCDIAIWTAAVVDYRPKDVAKHKIKKDDASLSLTLEKNKDIAQEMGKMKAQQYTVGFALETQDAEANAKKKLLGKNLNMIVLNTLEDEGAGFSGTTNKVTIFYQDGREKRYPLKKKTEVAQDLIEAIYEDIN